MLAPSGSCEGSERVAIRAAPDAAGRVRPSLPEGDPRGTRLPVVPGGCHAFDMFDLAIARASRAGQDAFANACLGG